MGAVVWGNPVVQCGSDGVTVGLDDHKGHFQPS